MQATMVLIIPEEQFGLQLKEYKNNFYKVQLFAVSACLIM